MGKKRTDIKMQNEKNSKLLGNINLSDNASFGTLLDHKKNLKIASEKIISQQKQVDDMIKNIIGDHQKFAFNNINGTYTHEYRGPYEVKESAPRVLRINTK